MYSMVLVMSMAGAPEVPQFGWHKGGGCYGSAPVVVQTYSSGCTGNYGGGHGCCLFGKLKSCFGGFCHKSNGCYGGHTYGGPVYTEAAPGCGTVVIPPSTGTVPHTEMKPEMKPEVKPEVKPNPIPPKTTPDAPKKTDPPKIG